MRAWSLFWGDWMSDEKIVHVKKLSDRARWNIWLAWSMTLAAIPRTVRQGLEPCVPGLPDLYLLSVALLVIALAGLFLPYCAEKIRKRLLPVAKPLVVLLGVITTVALIAVELYVMHIGRDSLGYRRYGQCFISAEFFCGLLSLLGWAFAQPGGGDLGAARVSFLLGAACPFAVMVLSLAVACPSGTFLASAISAAVVGASLAVLRTLNRFPRDFTLRYVAGQVFFSTIWWGRWAGEPVLKEISSVTLLLCILAGIVALLTGLYRAKEQGLSADSFSGASGAPLIPPFDDRAASTPLSPRERQVTERTLAGKTDAQIAEELAIGKSSVATLRRRSYLKLGVSGKKELLEKVSANSCASKPSSVIEGRCVPGFLSGLFTLTLITAALAILRVAGLSIPSTWGGYLVRPAVLVLLLFTCLSARPADCLEGGRIRKPAPLVAAQAFGAILLAYGMRSAAGQDYFQEPVYYSTVALVLLMLAQGFDTSQRGSAVSEPSFLIQIARNGVACFSALDYRVGLICAAAVVPFDFIGYREVATGVTQGLPGLPHMLLLAVLILCVRVISSNWSTCLDGELPIDERTNRAVLYLRGRGLSEVQARAIAHLALGASPQKVSALCHVSLGSLGTFRTRAYKKLDVSGMDDLRILLEREAGMPKHDKVSPVK